MFYKNVEYFDEYVNIHWEQQISRYLDVLADLQENNVNYVVSGGMAVVYHGVDRYTHDLDLIIDLSSPDNIEKFWQIMQKNKFIPRVREELERFKDPEVRNDWINNRNMLVFTFIHEKARNGTIDVLMRVGDNIDVKKLFNSSKKTLVKNVKVKILSPEKCLKMKKHSPRPKDKDDYRALQKKLLDKGK